MEIQTTLSIAGKTSPHKSLSPQREKSRIALKPNSSIKPNKFHFKPVRFGGRKTREERKICLKIRLFGFPEIVVMGSATTAACKVVLSLTLIGPLEFEREHERPVKFERLLKF